jgi:cytochrome c oxidase assembly protein Cox11
MGFCLYNNVGVAAQVWRRRLPTRVLIVVVVVVVVVVVIVAAAAAAAALCRVFCSSTRARVFVTISVRDGSRWRVGNGA